MTLAIVGGCVITLFMYLPLLNSINKKYGHGI